VPAGDVSEWTYPPFGAVIDGDRLYGRGSADMKAGLAAMIYATRAVELAGPFPGRILLGCLCDEEEMMIGVKHFVAQGWCDQIEAVISAEPEEGEICAVSKGAIRLRIDALGVMAHGAMPHQRANPVAALARVGSALGDLQAELQSRLGSYEHLGEVWVTPTFVEGGTIEQLNVIPRTAVMGVDIRTTPAVDHAELIGGIRNDLDAIGRASGVGVELTVIDDRPSTFTPADSPVGRALAAAHAARTGQPARMDGVPGSTQGRSRGREGGPDIRV